MKNKNISKIMFGILIIFILIICLWNSYSFADISSDAESFLDASSGDSAGNTEKMTEAIGDIAGVLTGAGFIVAVIIAAVLGIQFMTGGAEEKAKIKESIIPYVCGCVVIFGALGIWRLVVGLLNQTS